MIKKQLYLATLVIFSSHCLIASSLPTLSQNDPIPVYNASNNFMPSNNQIEQLKRAITKEIQPAKDYHFTVNLSGFIQHANRARGCSGCTDYGTVCDDYGSKGTQMGDYRGTMYALGLLLGNSPNGNTIFANGVNDGNIENVTANSINATQLPDCLKNIAKMLSGNLEVTGGGPPCNGGSSCTYNNAPSISGDETSTNLDQALLFNPQETTDIIPSVFSESYLATDTTFFGAFSLPLKYKKSGFRFEIGAEFGDHVAFTLQGGVANIKQTTTGLVSISDCYNILPGCATVDSGTISSGVPTAASGTFLYNILNFRDDGSGTVPTSKTAAQTLFNDQISDNAEDIFGTCGINQSLCTFDDYSLEDMRFFLTFKNSYGLDHYTRYSAMDDDWYEMIFTPYAWIGCSVPLAKKKDYKKLLSMPFGNNGHASLGGAIGMTFDFREGLEVGVEGGVTHFFEQEEYRPVPNHRLQRVIYPFWTNVKVKPGLDWHFKALLNSYQFINHISFWATYELVEHREDTFCICNNPTVYKTDPVSGKSYEENVFLPELLSCCSDWRAQMLNLALVFDIQPGMQMSFLWQQSLTPRNAYYPVTFMGSLTFLF